MPRHHTTKRIEQHSPFSKLHILVGFVALGVLTVFLTTVIHTTYTQTNTQADLKSMRSNQDSGSGVQNDPKIYKLLLKQIDIVRGPKLIYVHPGDYVAVEFSQLAIDDKQDEIKIEGYYDTTTVELLHLNPKSVAALNFKAPTSGQRVIWIEEERAQDEKHIGPRHVLATVVIVSDPARHSSFK